LDIMRVGVVFVNIAWRGTPDPSDDEIIQLSAVKLSSTNYSEFNACAMPTRIWRRDANQHRFTLDSNGNRLRKGDGYMVRSCLECEKDLIVNFGAWLDVRYDQMYLVCFDTKTVRMLYDCFDLYASHDYRLPNIRFVSARSTLKNFDFIEEDEHVELEDILRWFDKGYELEYDTMEDVRSFRRACISVAKKENEIPSRFWTSLATVKKDFIGSR